MKILFALSPETHERLKASTLTAKGLSQIILRGAQRAANEIVREVQENISGDMLKVRSGSLRRSVTSKVGAVDHTLTIEIGSTQGPATKYARIHEYGGTIRPIRAKLLAVPVGPALTPAGVPRYPSPRAVPVRLSYVPAKKAGVTGCVGLLVENKRRSKAGRIWYRLYSKVTLPARHWLGKSVKQAANIVPVRIKQAIEAALKR